MAAETEKTAAEPAAASQSVITAEQPSAPPRMASSASLQNLPPTTAGPLARAASASGLPSGVGVGVVGIGSSPRRSGSSPTRQSACIAPTMAPPIGFSRNKVHEQNLCADAEAAQRVLYGMQDREANDRYKGAKIRPLYDVAGTPTFSATAYGLRPPTAEARANRFKLSVPPQKAGEAPPDNLTMARSFGLTNPIRGLRGSLLADQITSAGTLSGGQEGSSGGGTGGPRGGFTHGGGGGPEDAGGPLRVFYGRPVSASPKVMPSAQLSNHPGRANLSLAPQVPSHVLSDPAMPPISLAEADESNSSFWGDSQDGLSARSCASGGGRDIGLLSGRGPVFPEEETEEGYLHTEGHISVRGSPRDSESRTGSSSRPASAGRRPGSAAGGGGAVRTVTTKLVIERGGGGGGGRTPRSQMASSDALESLQLDVPETRPSVSDVMGPDSRSRSRPGTSSGLRMGRSLSSCSLPSEMGKPSRKPSSNDLRGMLSIGMSELQATSSAGAAGKSSRGPGSAGLSRPGSRSSLRPSSFSPRSMGVAGGALQQGRGQPLKGGGTTTATKDVSLVHKTNRERVFSMYGPFGQRAI